MQKKVNKSNTEKAFTLIEALVGIAIILIAVIGPLSVSMNGVKTITQNKNRIIASYLAEEMVEELRNYRDHFAVACQSYTYEILQDSISNQKCANIDVSSVANINDTAQAVAWKIFLQKLSLNTESKRVFNSLQDNIDQSSFSITNGIPDDLANNTKQNCYTLYLNQNDYSCTSSSGLSTIFSRSVTLTKISNTAIKVEVSVLYNSSSLFGINNSYVNVIDYIYAR